MQELFILRNVVIALACVSFGNRSVAQNSAQPKQIAEVITVNASRADVWQAWTTTEGITSFFGRAAKIELRLNGSFEVYLDLDAEPGQRGSEGCKVLAFIPERMLAFSWNAPPKFGAMRIARTCVVIELDSIDEQSTKVTLTHTGWGTGEQWDQVFDYFSRAWPWVLEQLKKRFDEDAPREPAEIELPQLRNYVYIIHPTDMRILTAPTPDEVTALQGHVTHIRSMAASGRLILAGPVEQNAQFPDSTEAAVPFDDLAAQPGLVVFRAEDDAAAKAVMEADPAVAAGVFKARVNSFVLFYQE